MANELVMIADADRRIRNLVDVTLKMHDYKCITANSGESAILLASSNSPNVILLELALPDVDGIEVIKKVRSWSDVPIIVISSRKEVHDKVMALDAGADDYITKPFSVEELLAKLRVIKRRYLQMQKTDAAENSVFENGDIKIDYVSGCTYVKNNEIHLTPIEYKLLSMLARNVGKVLTHTEITREIWGNDLENNHMTLRTFMASLRKKINVSERKEEEYIHTHTGVGYRMIHIDTK